jgi:hypothetical protein
MTPINLSSRGKPKGFHSSENIISIPQNSEPRLSLREIKRIINTKEFNYGYVAGLIFAIIGYTTVMILREVLIR